MFKSEQIQIILSTAAIKLMKELEADKIVAIEGIKTSNIDESVSSLKIVVIHRNKKKHDIFYINFDETLNLESQLKGIIIKAIKLNYLSGDSRVIIIFDENLQNEFYTGIIVLDVSRVIYKIARFKLTELLEDSKILEVILKIAEEIRYEGREGKKIGTLFVVGEESELNQYLKQLILNPFYGYPESMRDILNNDLTETIKEFAQLDGAFIINKKGIIISAGTYIDIDTTDVKRYYGWGTKHLAAVAITQKTNSIAILISESGGKIKIFKKGKLVVKY